MPERDIEPQFTSNWRPDQLLLVRVDGTTEPIHNSYDGIKNAVENWIDFVCVSHRMGFYIDDEGLLRGLPLNVPVSMVSGRALYGPAVLCLGVPSDEGDTLPPGVQVVHIVERMALWWNNVTKACALVGQDPYTYAVAETVPPPTVTNIPKDWLQ